MSNGVHPCDILVVRRRPSMFYFRFNVGYHMNSVDCWPRFDAWQTLTSPGVSRPYLNHQEVQSCWGQCQFEISSISTRRYANPPECLLSVECGRFWTLIWTKGLYGKQKYRIKQNKNYYKILLVYLSSNSNWNYISKAAMLAKVSRTLWNVPICIIMSYYANIRLRGSQIISTLVVYSNTCSS